MSIIIKQIDENTIFINDKEVIRDMNNNWIAKTELHVTEIRFFQKYLKANGYE